MQAYQEALAMYWQTDDFPASEQLSKELPRIKKLRLHNVNCSSCATIVYPQVRATTCLTTHTLTYASWVIAFICIIPGAVDLCEKTKDLDTATPIWYSISIIHNKKKVQQNNHILSQELHQQVHSRRR